jgi:hypothetical protein
MESMDIYKFDDKTFEQRLEEYRAILKSDDYAADFKQLFQENKASMVPCRVIWKSQSSETEGNI